MDDYQRRQNGQYVLPQEVYRQVYWTIRDYNRMKRMLSGSCTRRYGGVQVSVSRGKRDEIPKSGMQVRERYAESAAIGKVPEPNAKAMAERVEAIENALECLPERYRDGIRRKLTEKIPYADTFHENTWKKWQQIMIYMVAVNMHLV